VAADNKSLFLTLIIISPLTAPFAHSIVRESQFIFPEKNGNFPLRAPSSLSGKSATDPRQIALNSSPFSFSAPLYHG
jgi:hypothetical protein